MHCMLDKQGYMHVHACTHPPTHASTCTHIHTDQQEILIAFPRQQILVNVPQCYVVDTLPVLFYFRGTAISITPTVQRKNGEIIDVQPLSVHNPIFKILKYVNFTVHAIALVKCAHI